MPIPYAGSPTKKPIQGRKSPGGQQIGGQVVNLLHPFRPNIHRSFRYSRRLAQEGGLALIDLDQGDRRHPHHRQNKARETGAGTYIHQIGRMGRDQGKQLGAVEHMAAPWIGQGSGPHQVQARLPLPQQLEIGTEPIDCFT